MLRLGIVSASVTVCSIVLYVTSNSLEFLFPVPFDRRSALTKNLINNNYCLLIISSWKFECNKFGHCQLCIAIQPMMWSSHNVSGTLSFGQSIGAMINYENVKWINHLNKRDSFVSYFVLIQHSCVKIVQFFLSIEQSIQSNPTTKSIDRYFDLVFECVMDIRICLEQVLCWIHWQ